MSDDMAALHIRHQIACVVRNSNSSHVQMSLALRLSVPLGYRVCTCMIA